MSWEKNKENGKRWGMWGKKKNIGPREDGRRGDGSKKRGAKGKTTQQAGV